MQETKKVVKDQKSNTMQSKGNEQNMTSSGGSSSKMENEAIKFPDTSGVVAKVVKTEIAKKENVEPTPIYVAPKTSVPDTKPEPAASVVVGTETEKGTYENSSRTPIAFVAGIIIGALVTSLIL